MPLLQFIVASGLKLCSVLYMTQALIHRNVNPLPAFDLCSKIGNLIIESYLEMGIFEWIMLRI